MKHFNWPLIFAVIAMIFCLAYLYTRSPGSL